MHEKNNNTSTSVLVSKNSLKLVLWLPEPSGSAAGRALWPPDPDLCRADVVAGAEHPLHGERAAHRVEDAELLRDAPPAAGHLEGGEALQQVALVPLLPARKLFF